MTDVHVYAPKPVRIEMVRRVCPTCEKRRAFLCVVYEWHGLQLTCLHCGDVWGDGERLARPFFPGWRKQNVDWARSTWARYVKEKP